MAIISTYLQKILSAVYGEEVRGSIHDALAAMNVESSNAVEYAKTAKDSAVASAATATASAQAAKTSESNAKIAEDVAVNKAGEAAEAAERARDSEVTVVNLEPFVTQKAQEAEDSKMAAALSEAEAKAAAERAKTVRIDMETLADQLGANKAAMEAFQTAMEAVRDSTVASEVNAHNSANTALNAAAKAEISKDDAETAAEEARKAKTRAETAKAGAEDAKTDAEAARDAASDSAGEAAASAASARYYSGKPPKPQDGTWWIWDPDEQEYVDSKIGCELEGPIGIGIADIQLTKGSHTPGTTDIYTVSLTDNTAYSIPVYNGRNGTGAGDVLGIWFDLVIPAEGWTAGEITVADERLLAVSTHKYFLSASKASCDEFLACNIQPKDITTSGFITFTSDMEPTKDLTVNLLRFELSANGTP